MSVSFKLSHKLPLASQRGCMVVGIRANAHFAQIATKIDALTNGYLSTVTKQQPCSDFKHTLYLHHLPHCANACALLLGIGEPAQLTAANFCKLISHIATTCQQQKLHDITLFLQDYPVSKQDFAWQIRQIVAIFSAAFYQIKAAAKQQQANVKMTIGIPDTIALGQAKHALRTACALVDGIAYSKNLSNLPANVATPKYLAQQAKQLAKKRQTLTCQVLGETSMRKLGMNTILAVGQGSAEDAQLIIVRYQGTSPKQAPIALVGKGITFDSGGLNVKSYAGMLDMKYDMCGAASVLGTIQTIAELELPLNVIGVLACAENMSGARAMKPGDIIKTLSGQDVEILNTDAEGRLVLCDALTYCERFKPSIVIDIATLTGACISALGWQLSGLMTSDDDLAAELLAAGDYSCDPVWRLPLHEDFKAELESEFADLKNIGGRYGGASIAAAFLSHFTTKYRWAHLDIAGSSVMPSGKKGGATGRPVALLTEFLLRQVTKK